MRRHSFLLALTLISSALSAQTTYQRWDMYPGATSFTSRGNIGPGVGEVLQGVHQTTNRGVMDVARRCQIRRFNTITQDQNCATNEGFDFVVRSGKDAHGPATGSRGILGAIKGLTLPKSNRNGACAWSVSSTLTAANAIGVPCVRHWSYGVSLHAAPGWTMDGQSVHATSSTSGANSHRNHSRNEDQSWQIVGTAIAASHPSQKRSWRLSTFVSDGVVMKLRCDGRAGYGGSFPIASTSAAPLAWDAQLDGGANCAGLKSVVAIGVARAHAPAPAGSRGAGLYVHGPYFVFFGAKASSTGVAIVPLLPFIPKSLAGAGRIHLQGVLGNASVMKLSNSQSVIP
jgi:hypothetical protein